MIRDRLGDAPREYSPAAHRATANVAYEYLVCATIWLLVGTVAGLVPAVKLNWPDFLAVSRLSFGRIRPIHTSTVFWGWEHDGRAGAALGGTLPDAVIFGVMVLMLGLRLRALAGQVLPPTSTR